MSRVQAATIPWAGHLVLLWAKDSMALIAKLHLILNTKKHMPAKIVHIMVCYLKKNPKQTRNTNVADLNTMCKEHLINTTYKYTICISRKKHSASNTKITQLVGVTYAIIT